MRDIKIEVTCTVLATVPDDSPLLAPERHPDLVYGAHKANDYSDGRYPYASELLHDGAERLAKYAVSHALFEYHTLRLVRGRPYDPATLSERNRAVQEDVERGWVRVTGADPIAVAVSVSPERLP